MTDESDRDAIGRGADRRRVRRTFHVRWPGPYAGCGANGERRTRSCRGGMRVEEVLAVEVALGRGDDRGVHRNVVARIGEPREVTTVYPSFPAYFSRIANGSAPTFSRHSV